ncbi:MAG: hypothetical protein ACYDDU_12200 [Dermatophilaceae bacterium]|jgi:hypothetical protein
MTTSTWGPWNFLDRPESHPVEVLIVVAPTVSASGSPSCLLPFA